MRNILALACLFGLSLFPASAETQDDEITRLMAEVAQLREECQTLRKMLAEPAETPAQPATNRVTVVVEEKTPETALLRAECQMLRKLLATPAVLSQPAPAPIPEKDKPNETPQAETTQNTETSADVWQVTLPPGQIYWLTASSGVRHNPTCPNYQNTKGRPCAVDEGRPCSKCGG